MLKGLTLKYDTHDNWRDFLQTNSFSPVCKIVAKNGEGNFNPVILAALSPFLKDMLSSVPPYIEGCIIMPDIEFTEVSQFLESLFHPNKNITVTQSLVRILGINLELFNEATVRNLVKEELEDNEMINSDCDQSLSSSRLFKVEELSGSMHQSLMEPLKKKKQEIETTSKFVSKDHGHCMSKGKGKRGPKKSVPVGDGQLSCNVCGKQYNRKSHLNQHKASAHEGVRYPCDRCGKSFYDPSNLMRHIAAAHEGVTFFCEQCNVKPFSNYSNLMKHKAAVHQGVKHLCDQCGIKPFKYAHLLKRHKAVVHEAIRYPCDQCEVTTKDITSLKRHKVLVHQGLQS